MRFLITSDWHLDTVTVGVPRFRDIDQAVGDLLRESFDVFCFLGDLCDPDKGSRTLGCVANAVALVRTIARRAKVASIWVAGNHDVTGDKTLTSLSPLANAGFDGVWVAERPEVIELPDTEFRIGCLPYPVEPGAYVPELEVQKAGWRGLDMVLAHLTVPSAELGSETHEMPRGRDVVLPVAQIKRTSPAALVFNGHYHKAQTTPDGVTIPGSLARLRFDEELNQPSYVMVEV